MRGRPSPVTTAVRQMEAIVQARQTLMSLIFFSTVLLPTTGCLSITSFFNNKRVIPNEGTRDLISDIALLGDTIVGFPVAAVVKSFAHVKEGTDTTGFIVGVAVIAALPLIIIDYLFAQGIHHLIYGEEYVILTNNRRKKEKTHLTYE